MDAPILHAKRQRYSKPPLEIPAQSQQLNRIGSYRLEKQIGRGGSGVVYKAVNMLTGDMVAVKKIALDGQNERDVQAEIVIHKNLEHPNIVKFLHSIKENQCVYIIMELARCSLSKLVGELHKQRRIDEPFAAHLMAQIMEGVRYLHEQGIVHRDLKGGNILVGEDGCIKLADFGRATRLDCDEADTSVTTTHFTPPEGFTCAQPLSPGWDVWSVGCVLIQIVTGKPPNFHLPWYNVAFQMMSGVFPLAPKEVSAALQDFLGHCFQENARDRGSATDLLQHHWLDQTQKS